MIVRTIPYADLLERDGEALLLTEGTLLRLSAVGAAVVRPSTASTPNSSRPPWKRPSGSPRPVRHWTR